MFSCAFITCDFQDMIRYWEFGNLRILSLSYIGEKCIFYTYQSGSSAPQESNLVGFTKKLSVADRLKLESFVEAKSSLFTDKLASIFKNIKRISHE